MLVRHVSKVQIAMEPEFMFVIKTYKPNYSSYIHPRKGHLQDKTINTKWDRHIDTSDRPPSKTYKKNHKFRSTRSSPLPSPPSNNSCKKQRSARWSALKWRTNYNCQLLTDPPPLSSVYMGLVGQKNQVCSTALFPIIPVLITPNYLHFQPILAC